MYLEHVIKKTYVEWLGTNKWCFKKSKILGASARCDVDLDKLLVYSKNICSTCSKRSFEKTMLVTIFSGGLLFYLELFLNMT